MTDDTIKAAPEGRRYRPASLGEIYDLLGSMMLSGPLFIDSSGHFPYMNIDSEFDTLLGGFSNVRARLGEARYASLVDLAGRAKALFADDPQETNGKTREGAALLYEIEEIIQSVRRRRVRAKATDEEGEVTGD